MKNLLRMLARLIDLFVTVRASQPNINRARVRDSIKEVRRHIGKLSPLQAMRYLAEADAMFQDVGYGVNIASCDDKDCCELVSLVLSKAADNFNPCLKQLATDAPQTFYSVLNEIGAKRVRMPIGFDVACKDLSTIPLKYARLMVMNDETFWYRGTLTGRSFLETQKLIVRMIGGEIVSESVIGLGIKYTDDPIFNNDGFMRLISASNIDHINSMTESHWQSAKEGLIDVHKRFVSANNLAYKGVILNLEQMIRMIEKTSQQDRVLIVKA